MGNSERNYSMVATPTFPSSHDVVLVTAGITAPLGLSSIDLGDSPTEREELNLKEVLDQLDTHISGLIMIRETICRINEGDGRQLIRNR